MTQKKTIKDDQFAKLTKFLKQNKKIEWQTINLVSYKNIEMLNWKGLEGDQETVLKEVKGYQRLFRVLGEDNPKLIKTLLKKNIHSAIQIASMPQNHFIEECSKIFKNDEAYMTKVYKKALAIRSQLLLKYMEHTQNKEPHASQLKTL